MTGPRPWSEKSRKGICDGAVRVATEQKGFLYGRDRLTEFTGVPIEEKKVWCGTVPGRWYSRTQPISAEAAGV